MKFFSGYGFVESILLGCFYAAILVLVLGAAWYVILRPYTKDSGRSLKPFTSDAPPRNAQDYQTFIQQ